MKPSPSPLLACIVGLWLLSTVAAAQTMSTEQAVKTLLGGDPPAPAAQAWPLAQKDSGRIPPSQPATRMNDDGRATLVVPRGASVVSLLAPVLARSSLPKETLIRAFVQLNPAAFVRGNPNRLMAGATVRLFNDADLAQLQSGSAAPRRDEDRRNWVRYP